MKTALLTLFFIAFGLVWPVCLGQRTRGKLMLACMAAPLVGFALGRLAK